MTNQDPNSNVNAGGTGSGSGARGDDVYQPDEGGDREVHEDTGILDPEDTLVDRGLADVLDEGYSPPERPLAVEDTGTTGGEQRTGESLDSRLARERPEPRPPSGDGLGDSPDSDGELLDPEAGGLRSGRLIAPDEGVRARDNALTGEDVGIDGGAASAEEAAVHVVDEPPEPGPDGGEDGGGSGDGRDGGGTGGGG